ncbi:MAG: photosystem II biogenesis protein Psp29 [Pleurocapsa sp.]
MEKDQEQRDATLDNIIKNYNYSGEKLKKAQDIYRGNLEKMTELLKVIEDVLEASR